MSALIGMTQTDRDPNQKILAGFRPVKDPLDQFFCGCVVPKAGRRIAVI